MTEYREEHERARDAGLRARHETRLRRAIRREVASELLTRESIDVVMDEFDRHGRMWSEADSTRWFCRCGIELQEMSEPGSSRLARRHVVAELVQVLAREIGSKGGSDD